MIYLAPGTYADARRRIHIDVPELQAARGEAFGSEPGHVFARRALRDLREMSIEAGCRMGLMIAHVNGIRTRRESRI